MNRPMNPEARTNMRRTGAGVSDPVPLDGKRIRFDLFHARRVYRCSCGCGGLIQKGEIYRKEKWKMQFGYATRRICMSGMNQEK